jgi:hypothetical protein
VVIQTQALDKSANNGDSVVADIAADGSIDRLESNGNHLVRRGR